MASRAVRFVLRPRVDCRLDAAQLRGYAGQVLSVSHEQVPVDCKVRQKVGDHSSFRVSVEVDQNIAAKNGVKRAVDEVRLLVQVQSSEVDRLLYLDSHLHLPLAIGASS